MNESKKSKMKLVAAITAPLLIALMGFLLLVPTFVRPDGHSTAGTNKADSAVAVASPESANDGVGAATSKTGDSHSVNSGQSKHIDDGDEPYRPSAPVAPTMTNDANAPIPKTDAMVFSDLDPTEASSLNQAGQASDSGGESHSNAIADPSEKD